MCMWYCAFDVRLPQVKDLMIKATIVITIQYAPDADMEEALDDEQPFKREVLQYFGPSIAGRDDDIQIEYSIAEVKEI